VFRLVALECATRPVPTAVRMQGDADDTVYTIPILSLNFYTADAMREWLTVFNGHEDKPQDNANTGRRIFGAFGDFGGWRVQLHAYEPIPAEVTA
jgi:hypothetical protein